MKLWLLLAFCTVSSAMAQTAPVEGIVFDKATKDRIAKVNIRNLNSGVTIYNNLKGEFKIIAAAGDALLFTREGYFPDTVKLQTTTTIAVYLKRTGIPLQQVDINDTIITPEKWLANTKRDYTKIYGSDPDALVFSPGGGVGIGIDALYNAFSKSAHNAEKLRGTIEADYQQNVIDYRFNRRLVTSITGLKSERLTDFMRKYRPGYYFVSTATEYDFIKSIRSNYRRYLRNPRNFSLMPLESGK